MSSDGFNARSHERFRTTRWSVVLDAGSRSGGAAATRALSELCQIYWAPLYAYLRRTGSSPVDAEDLVQGFIADLLTRDDLQRIDPARGRFRSFLLASLKHFVANQRDRTRAQKRGGGQTILPLEITTAEHRLQHEPVHAETAEKVFDRQWAITLLDRVRSRLREDYTTSGKGDLVAALEVHLTGEAGAPSHAATAERLRMSESAVKMAVHRLRQRFGERLREEIAHTVSSADEVEEEIRQLLSALQGRETR